MCDAQTYKFIFEIKLRIKISTERRNLMAKQYLDLAGLTTYDGLIKAHISSEVSKKSDKTHNHDDKYDKKGASSTALSEAKAYTDTVKNGLLNGAGQAYDTLLELGNLIDDNTDAIEALETVATNKADKTHKHTVADITDLTVTAAELNHMDGVTSNIQAQLDSKVNERHSHSWEDIEDKPFYETEPVLTTVVPPLTFNNWYYESRTDLSPFVAGQKGNVIYDGVAYNDVPCVDDGGVVILGNVNNRYTDYPFQVYISNGYLFINTPYASGEISHTIQVAIGVTQVVKLDEKFLPNYAGEVVTGKTFVGQEDKGGRFAEIFNDYNNNVATGDYAHAEGKQTFALGDNSHSEGAETTASGLNSHVEGEYSEAKGSASHAEGYSCVTEAGYGNHSEGFFTTSKGTASHSEGYYTIAGSDNQHVQGKYNIEDTNGDYAHIVGNGEHNARSNAHTLDWDGNAWFAGDVTATDSKGNKVSLITLLNRINQLETMLGNVNALIDEINGEVI